jgi:hypothetical protein
MKKRLVAFLLVLIMVLGMLPVSAMAAGSVVTARGSAENPIRIYENSGNKAETSNGSVQVPVGETVTDSGVLTFSTYSAIEGVQVSTGGFTYCYITSSNENVVKATGGWNGGVLTINFQGVGNGTARITVDYTCTCSKGAAANGYLIYNVTVGDGGSTDPSEKPNAPTASDIGAFPDAGKAVLLHCVDAGARGHDATASSLNKVQNGYSVGEVVENPGTYYNVDGGKITKEQFPWMCVVTVHAAPFIELYNSNFSESYGVHKLAGTSNATATLHWFWHNTYGWQYLENPPIQFNITRDTSEKTYTLNYYKNTTDTVTNMPEPNPQTEKSNTGMVTFTVSSAIPAREGYNFLGWNGKPDATEPTVMPGNTITTPRETTNLYAVWESKTPPPEIPGDQKPNIEEANAKIRVQCIEYPSKHNPYKQNYRILPGSYEDLGWDQTEYGYIYSIRLNRAKYIAQFDQEIGRPHTDTEPNKETRINWRWENGAWHLNGGPDGIDADIKVKCDQTETPPTKPIITGRQEYIRVICKNEPNKERNYVPKFGRYTESDPAVQKVNGVWTYTITILRDKHVEEFNKDFPGHEDTDPNAVTTMSWVWKDAEWKLVPVNGLRTVGAIIEVTCKPKAPTADELKKLDMAVQVKCVVDAAQQHTDAYGLLGEYDEDYFVGEPRKDGDDWLCDISYDPNLYVAEFNTTFQNLKHVQNDEKIVPVTLIWAGDSWQLKTQGRVHVTEVYTVTYTDGVDGEEVFADQVYSDLRKDSTTPAFNGTPTRTGYTFAGWEPEVAATVTQTVTYVAKWEAKKANVHLMIFKSGDLSKPIVDVPYAADKLAGDTIDLTKIDPSSYLDFDFEIDGGWYDDGMFNSYKRYLDGLQDKPAGLEKLLITGNWQNLKLIVTELVPVVYFDSLESLTAYQNDHSKTEGILRTTKARVGSALPTADAPTATRNGYTFTFWSREGQTVDVTGQTVNGWTNLYANWEKKTFTVKYYLPDETGAWVEKKMDTVDSVDYATYSLWTPNAEDGYEFSGWYQKAADIGVKAKVEKLYMAKEWKLYGKFTPIEYTIQYVYNDGKATSTNPTTYTVESDTITLADATGADWGKTFLEWHDENGQKITEIPTGSTGDRVITAYWNWPVHLHYLDKDNNEIESATLYVSELEPGACVLPTGEKTGYDFDGWYEAKKDIGTASHKLNALSIAKKWELYGRYTAKTDVSYTVKYLREGDNKVLAPEKVVTDQTFDTEVTEQAADVVGYTPDAPSKTMILDEYNKVLTFSYSANTYDYTVRHIKQLPDGSYDEANAEVETLSGKFEALAVVTAKDYGSHYPTNDADTKQNIKIEEGLTIDVKYDLDEHTLTFETNGGSAINPVTVRHGNAVARPADPTKDKYTFIGWYADPEFTEEYDFATVLEADKTIYAKFELTSTPIGDIYVRYDVLHIKQLPDGTYDLANAEVEHLSAKKDTTVTAVIKDYRATHHVNVNRTLSKLTDTAIQAHPGADGKPVYTILTVYYDLDFHTLTFDTMGGSKIAPETVRHGLTVAKPKDPVNGGYIFDGWYTDKTFRHRYDFSTPLTEDITIYAKWFLIVLPGVTVKKNTPKLNTADHFAYVQGYPDGTVKPAGNITRAETAAILFRLMDDASRKTYYSTKSGFRDVASGSWYNTYVATLNNAGVITDSSNGYFRPNEAITRAELAAMLAKFSETTGAANYFNDVSAKYWAANAIAICAKLGWITGYPDGTFRPDKNVTRAELMAMINRATGRAPKSADAFLPGMKTWIDNTSDKWYYLDVQEATNSHSYTVKGSETWTALTSDPNWSLYE